MKIRIIPNHHYCSMFFDHTNRSISIESINSVFNNLINCEKMKHSFCHQSKNYIFPFFLIEKNETFVKPTRERKTKNRNKILPFDVISRISKNPFHRSIYFCVLICFRLKENIFCRTDRCANVSFDLQYYLDFFLVDASNHSDSGFVVFRFDYCSMPFFDLIKKIRS